MLYLRFILSLLLVCFLGESLQAGGIKGKIVAFDDNSPLAFANIFCKEIGTGTSTNIDGNYELALAAGKYTIVFQYLGYQPITKEIVVGTDYIVLDVKMETRTYVMKEVQVRSRGEDPANFVMRKAVAMAKYYGEQLQSYDVKLYIKGFGTLDKLPWLLKKKIEKEANIKEGDKFLLETVSEVHFEQPNFYKEKILAMRSNMPDNDSPMRIAKGSFYKSAYDAQILSPLSPSAFGHYKFVYEGSFKENNVIINKIRVIPRYKSQNLYAGYLNIVENYWNLHSLDLSAGMSFGKVGIKQVFAPVQDKVWMPTLTEFDVKGDFMGAEGTFKYVATYSNYQVKLNTLLDHQLLDRVNGKSIEEIENQQDEKEKEVQKTIVKTVPSAPSKKQIRQEKRQKEIEELLKKEELTRSEAMRLVNKMQLQQDELQEKNKNEIDSAELMVINDQIVIDSAAKRKDADFWNENRAIPLTQVEVQTYHLTDTVKKTASPSADTLKATPAKVGGFNWSSVITGTSRFKKRHNWRYDGLINLDYNTVDGFALNSGFYYRQRYDSAAHWSLYPKLRYNFARQVLNAKLETEWFYSPLHLGKLNAEGGVFVQDFNTIGKTGIPPLINSFTTLFAEQNYLKLYQKSYLHLGNFVEITNGLKLTTSLTYENRQMLDNHSDFRIINVENRVFSNNQPRTLSTGETAFVGHQALIGEIGVSHTFRQRYYKTQKGRKIYAKTNYPTVYAFYRQAFPMQAQDADFAFLKLGWAHKFQAGYKADFRYEVEAGTFLSKNHLYFPDYHHFATVEAPVYGGDSFKTLRLLPYYLHSTNATYLEAHAEYQNHRLLIKRLPYFNMTQLRESFFVNYLNTNTLSHYTEVGYGVSQILLLLRVDVVAGFEAGKYQSFGFRVGMNF